jgi:hypothetical protein
MRHCRSRCNSSLPCASCQGDENRGPGPDPQPTRISWHICKVLTSLHIPLSSYIAILIQSHSLKRLWNLAQCHILEWKKWICTRRVSTSNLWRMCIISTIKRSIGSSGLRMHRTYNSFIQEIQICFKMDRYRNVSQKNYKRNQTYCIHNNIRQLISQSFIQLQYSKSM